MEEEQSMKCNLLGSSSWACCCLLELLEASDKENKPFGQQVALRAKQMILLLLAVYIIYTTWWS